MPLAIGLLNAAGHDIPLQLEGEPAPRGTSLVLSLRQERTVFRFVQVPTRPVPSLARNFSAPVIIDYAYGDDDLRHLLSFDSDPFNRWEAGQRLATGMLFIVFIVGEGFGRAVNGFLDTRWGNLFILDDQIESLWMAMFGDVGTLGRVVVERPLHWSACALTVAGTAALALALFAARVRAQEVSR